MNGKYMNGKIHYFTPRYNFLTGGNWKDGFSKVSSSGGNIEEYEILPTDIILEEGKWYDFELIDGKAKIIHHDTR